MKRVGGWLLLFWLCVPAAVIAQTPGVETETETGFAPIFGVRYSVPFKLSGYGGVGLAELEHDRTFWKIGAVGELGASGGQISLTSGAAVFHPFPIVLRGQVSALRTWRSPLVVRPEETYVGIEARVFFLLLGGSVGVFHRIGEGEGDPLLIFGGVHWGL